jgi:hypothetical protein
VTLRATLLDQRLGGYLPPTTAHRDTSQAKQDGQDHGEATATRSRNYQHTDFPLIIGRSLDQYFRPVGNNLTVVKKPTGLGCFARAQNLRSAIADRLIEQLDRHSEQPGIVASSTAIEAGLQRRRLGAVKALTTSNQDCRGPRPAFSLYHEVNDPVTHRRWR